MFLVAVAGAIVLTTIVFVVYSVGMDRQSRQISQNAAQAKAVVDSMFPGQIRDRVLEQQGDGKSRGSVASMEAPPHLAESYEDTTLFFGGEYCIQYDVFASTVNAHPKS